MHLSAIYAIKPAYYDDLCINIQPNLEEKKISGKTLKIQNSTTSFLKNKAIKPNNLKPGLFVCVHDPKYFKDVAQIIDININSGKVLLKMIPRINYRDMHAFSVKTQSALNCILDPRAIIPQNFFKTDLFVSEQKQAKLNISWAKDGYVDAVQWDGDKYIGKFLYKKFLLSEVYTAKIPRKKIFLFKSNLTDFERNDKKFMENLESFLKKNNIDCNFDSESDANSNDFDLSSSDFEDEVNEIVNNENTRLSQAKKDSTNNSKEENISSSRTRKENNSSNTKENASLYSNKKESFNQNSSKKDSTNNSKEENINSSRMRKESNSSLLKESTSLHSNKKESFSQNSSKKDGTNNSKEEGVSSSRMRKDLNMKESASLHANKKESFNQNASKKESFYSNADNNVVYDKMPKSKIKIMSKKDIYESVGITNVSKSRSKNEEKTNQSHKSHNDDESKAQLKNKSKSKIARSQSEVTPAITLADQIAHSSDNKRMTKEINEIESNTQVTSKIELIKSDDDISKVGRSNSQVYSVIPAPEKDPPVSFNPIEKANSFTPTNDIQFDLPLMPRDSFADIKNHDSNSPNEISPKSSTIEYYNPFEINTTKNRIDSDQTKLIDFQPNSTSVIDSVMPSQSYNFFDPITDKKNDNLPLFGPISLNSLIGSSSELNNEGSLSQELPLIVADDGKSASNIENDDQIFKNKRKDDEMRELESRDKYKRREYDFRDKERNYDRDREYIKNYFTEKNFDRRELDRERDRDYYRERSLNRDREYFRERDLDRDYYREKNYDRDRYYDKDREYFRERDFNPEFERDYLRNKDYLRDKDYLREKDFDRDYLREKVLDRNYIRGRDYLREKDLDREYLRAKDLNRDYLREKDLDKDYLRGKDLDKDYLRGKDLDRDHFRAKDLDRDYLREKNLDRDYLRGKDLDRNHFRAKDLDRDYLREKDLDKDYFRKKDIDRDYLREKDLERDYYRDHFGDEYLYRGRDYYRDRGKIRKEYYE